MDIESRKLWEHQQSMCGDELPTWSQLVEFLESRFRSLEMMDTGKQSSNRPTLKPKSFHAALTNENQPICVLCNGPHFIFSCKEFGQKGVRERQQYVQENGLCFNCLSNTHSVSRCRQIKSCRRCRRRHHSLLHFEKENHERNTNNTITKQTEPQREENKQQNSDTTTLENRVVANFARGELHSYNVLLATAIVKSRSKCGTKLVFRTLLDQGSQASFVTEATVQLLGLKREPINGLVSGIGNGQVKIKHMTSLVIESFHNPQNIIQVNAYVMSSLASLLPTSTIHTPDWLELENLTLADPGFATPGKIDILLGADVYGEVLLNDMIKHPQGNLIAQNTILGWVISGRATHDTTSARREIASMHINIREDEFLRKFWDMENEPNSLEKKLTEEELKCEELYEKTTTRNEEGRFVVKLPFKDEEPRSQYGQTKEIATRKLLSLEKRLLKDEKLYIEYQNVMQEYLTLNHMSLIKGEDIENPKSVYLPHHAVVREDKDTTKVRVVYNASSKGVNNVSLNDDLLVGPKLQQDLRHLLMRWRKFRVCIIADLVKMYRQVRVTEEDANYQRILWRNNPDEPIQHFKLLTLTFGTACAPYLAVKTLQKLADVEQSNYPIASEITKKDYYIDDLMTGCDSFEEAVEIYEQMNKLMNSGGFQLQKWSSNDSRFLKYIDKEKHRSDQLVPIKVDNMMKVLGIGWNRETDNFEYTVNLPESKQPITKRQVLSDIARLYDPIGWISPVVITAKIFIQKLWKLKLEWDDEITDGLLAEWIKFREDLVNLKDILIPRWLNSERGCKTELHAFSDASQVAYAAAVYIRVKNEEIDTKVSLVTAKTKVAPIDKESSIPRLELCGAVLAAKLLHEVSQVMNIPKENLHAWTDSTVVLAWLKGPPCRWATFVSNRVSEILTMTEYNQWRYVSTNANPADCASRGLKPDELKNHTLWWNGPSWLSEPTINTETIKIEETHEEERTKSLTTLTHQEEDFVWTKYSSLGKMLRVISYCRRFLNYNLPKNERETLPNYITVNELEKTLQMCIKQVQNLEFGDELKKLNTKGHLTKGSLLYTLHPFCDQNGIVRVGGRIEHASASFDERHPIIMPSKSHLTQLLVADAHTKTMHGGPQLMLNHLRTKYWIIRARDQVKKHFRKCVVCLRHSKVTNQLMGQLPEARLKPSKPFKSAGVDYAGPINIRFSPGRGSKSYKGYICLFVCMVTRAIHLEAVTDLSAKGFIAAFRRFTSRRGHCQDLHSDNGSNFVKANKELQAMLNDAKSELPREIAHLLTLENTRWHFIPPQSPNFGGLWEAGVRSVKTHLKKVIGDSTLTYEELSTALTQIEACLNSRPLSVLSDDPNDPLPLTPGHFLVGEPLLNVSDVNYCNKNISGIERWNVTQKMVNEFWKRWSKEYLLNLSHRYKWNSKKPEPDVNDIVVLRDDFLPPSKWLLGKIIAKHPGRDMLTRVVTVKCKNGCYKRPLNKICVLTKSAM
nr:uncharacterized protein LOC117986080 [Maniola hyperantus]